MTPVRALAWPLALATLSTGCCESGGDVTVYNVRCDDSVSVERCWSAPTAPYTAAPTVYRASSDRQSVIYWIGDSLPSTLDNCIVRDKDDWVCEDLDGWEKIAMHDGKLTQWYMGDYRHLNTDPLVTHRPQVSWLRYRILQLQEFLGAL